jgi:hypothetical protein
VLLQGWAGEPKWDGGRALVSVEAGRVILRSRRGTDLVASFPEIDPGAGSAGCDGVGRRFATCAVVSTFGASGRSVRRSSLG